MASLLPAQTATQQVEALYRAAQLSRRPPEAISAALERVDAGLDRRFGPVGYQPPPAPGDGGDSWRDRPDSDFVPF